MAKRRAEKQLNKDEVELDDDEEEDSGEFTKADNNVMANRVIKQAKRRSPAGSSQGPNPLANFAGFSPAPKSSPFSLGGLKEAPKTTTVESSESSANPPDLENLKALNFSCASWIKQHLDKNPYVLLLPVFKDYEKHLASLNLKTVAETSNSIMFSGSTSVNNKTETPPFSFTKSEPVTTEPTKSFSFGVTPKTEAASSDDSKAAPKFSFGLPPSTTPAKASEPAKGLSFGTTSASEPAKGLSFGAPLKTSEPAKGLTEPAKGLTEPAKSESFAKSTSGTTVSSEAKPAFSFGLNSVSSTTGGFNFGTKQADKTDGPAPTSTFSFGLNNGASTTSNAPTPGGFFFGAPKGMQLFF